MGDRLEALARIDRYFAAARIAHEAIWDLHHELVVTGTADIRTRRLLGEAARIVTLDMPELVEEVRRLDVLWVEQDLLDRSAAADTLGALVAEVDRVEPHLAALRAHQNEVALEFLRLTNADG